VIVEQTHFAYLRLQKGSLDHLAGDFPAWLVAYERSLRDDFASLEPHLPDRCDSLLDIGSGLGGIDVLLDRHYGGGVHVRLLDGIDDPPVMTRHAQPYNSMVVARDFQHKNGVRYLGCYPPLAARSGAVDGFVCDLVISLGSWCFHYPPANYLDFVARHVRAGTVLVLDVRADRPLWREQLSEAFVEVAVALERPKFNRVVFHAR
jgi:SAM-dependent methyltransferase